MRQKVAKLRWIGQEERPSDLRAVLIRIGTARRSWRALSRLKDMACRTLLLKLERAGHIRLPPRIRPSSNGCRGRSPRQDFA